MRSPPATSVDRHIEIGINLQRTWPKDLAPARQKGKAKVSCSIGCFLKGREKGTHRKLVTMGMNSQAHGELQQACERAHVCGAAHPEEWLLKDRCETMGSHLKLTGEGSNSRKSAESCTIRQWIWFFIKVVAWSFVATLLFLVIVVKGVPWMLSKVFLPLLQWESDTFSKPILAVVIFLSLSLCHAVFLPQGPTVWLAGITFGFTKAILLVLAGVAMGFSVPFVLGRWLLQERMLEWFLKRPQYHNILKLVERGDWGHQFKVVLLIRVSPLPSPLFNYLVTVTKIGYGPYIAASMATAAPEAVVNVYSGVLLKSLSDYGHHEHKRSKIELVAQGVALIAVVAVTIGIMLYGRKALQKMEAEQEEAERMKERDVETSEVGYCEIDHTCQQGADGYIGDSQAGNDSEDGGLNLAHKFQMSAHHSLKQPLLQGSSSARLSLKINK